jgi:predicted peroxiredoxin
MKRVLLVIVILMFLPAAAFAGSDAPKTFLIHVKNSMNKHDARTVVMPHVALTALLQGYKVIILFDDEGVQAIKIGHWYGGHTTPLDKTELPEEELRSLSARLGVPSTSIPDNYGDFLRFLKGKGVELFVNKVAMDLRNIGGDRFDHAVTPVAIEKMVEIFEGAAVTVTY